jgi:hypothetical protein
VQLLPRLARRLAGVRGALGMEDLSSGLPHGVSVAFVSGMSLAVLAGLAFCSWRFAFHARGVASARRAAAGALELRPGSTIVHGIVHTDDAKPAIVVETREAGREVQTKSSWSHTWTEQHRSVTVRPFDVVLGDRTRVRVVPHQRLRFIDDMVVTQHDSERMRVRRAELAHGDGAFIEGTLAHELDPRSPDGYRGSGKQWVLRFPEGARPLVSGLALEEPYVRWRRFWAGASSCALVLCVLVAALSYERFWRFELRGVVVDAEVTDLRHYTTHSTRNGTKQHYVVRARGALPDGTAVNLEDEIDRDPWVRLQLRSRVAFLVDPESPESHEIGTAPHLESWGAFVGVFVLVLAAFLVGAAHKRRKRWFEMEKIKYVSSGRLPPAGSLLGAAS